MCNLTFIAGNHLKLFIDVASTRRFGVKENDVQLLAEVCDEFDNFGTLDVKYNEL